MRDFSKGWRRKVGVVTLVLACVFATGWTWSLSTFDSLRFYGKRDLPCEIMSLDQFIVFSCRPIAGAPQIWHSQWTSTDRVPFSERWVGLGFTIREYGRGLLIVGTNTGRNPDYFVALWYGSVVIPLALLSVLLLLAQTRSKKLKQTTEPAPTTRT